MVKVHLLVMLNCILTVYYMTENFVLLMIYARSLKVSEMIALGLHAWGYI